MSPTSARTRIAAALRASARLLAASDDLWEVLEYGSPEEIEAALKPYKKLKISFLNRTLDDTYLVEDKIVEWEQGEKHTSVHSKDDWIQRAVYLREEIADRLAEEFRKDFGRHPSPLYHATDDSNIESIMAEGLRAENRTRGFTNRGVGAAVFTTIEPDVAAFGAYGNTVIKIDTPAMKRDGVRFTAEQEPFVFEKEAAGTLAAAVGLHDFYWEANDGADDYNTVILFIRDNIAPKYLKVLD